MTLPNHPTDVDVQQFEMRAEKAEESPVPVFLKVARVVVWILYAIVLVNAIMLTLAFFLRLFGANPDAGFVEWVYRSVEDAMRPFRGIFPTHDLSDASVLDMSLLFAAIFYFVIAMLIDVVVRWLTRHLQAQAIEASQLRAQADYVAHQAAVDRAAADNAIREATAREYAAQQAAHQFAADAAARQAAIDQASRGGAV